MVTCDLGGPGGKEQLEVLSTTGARIFIDRHVSTPAESMPASRVFDASIASPRMIMPEAEGYKRDEKRIPI